MLSWDDQCFWPFCPDGGSGDKRGGDKKVSKDEDIGGGLDFTRALFLALNFSNLTE
jgi:hypothetical protein